MRLLRPVASVGVWCLAGSLSLGAAPVAAVPGDPFDMRTACRDDFQRFCRELGNEAARGEIRRCLKSHEAKVSAGCRVALGEETGGGDEQVPTTARPSDSCRAEMRALCPDASEPQVMRKCISERRGQLSQECRDQLSR